MTDRPTPETDAMIETDAHRTEEYSAPLTAYRRMCELAKTLERERDEAREDLKATQQAWVQVKTERIEALRERDEAREAAEKAKAYKRVMKEDNAKLRRELDELNKRLIEVCQYGVVCTVEREDLHKELAAERALADRMGHSIERLCNMSPLIYAHAMDDLNAWKEARK